MDIETIRAEASRKLGRNVLNFAKIEAGLKLLLSVSRVEGTTKTISEQVLSNRTRLRKQTLGRLVQEFNKNIMGDASQVEHPAEFSGSGISISFKVTYNDPDCLKVKKRELSAIVTERNKLIHQDLAHLDTTSVEDYRELIGLLDEQNPRLLTYLEELRWMLISWKESLEGFQSLVKSPDFLQHIQSNQDDA
jgi:hypothetical protein